MPRSDPGADHRRLDRQRIRRSRVRRCVGRRDHAGVAAQLVAHRSADLRSVDASGCADRATTETHNRRRVSNDNPFSESEFRTMKYRPSYPGIFITPTLPAATRTNISPCTTPNTGIPGSRCAHPIRSTTEPGASSAHGIAAPTRPTTKHIPNDSAHQKTPKPTASSESTCQNPTTDSK